jgi:hypothetical protein
MTRWSDGFVVWTPRVLGLLFGVVLLSWRWEWVGGVVFSGLAIGYAYLARRRPGALGLERDRGRAISRGEGERE